MPNNPKNNTPDKALVERLLLCAEQSEQGKNFADTPYACREAAELLSQPQHGGLVEAAQPIIDEINRLEREYGFDRPDHQGQCLMLPLIDLKRFRAALSNSPVVGEDGPPETIDGVETGNTVAPNTPTDIADRREAVARIINDGQGDPKHDRPSAGNAAWAKALKKTDAILSLIAEQPVSQAAFDAAADWHDNGGAELIARGAQSRPYAEFRAEVMGKVSGAPVEAMVMAPVEPTEAMTEAGCVFIPGPRSAAKAARVWSAMIGARPGADA